MNLIQKIKNDKILNTIASEFDNEVYLVGGAVRDFVLGKDTFDRDLIVCDECAREFSLKLAKQFDAVFVPLDEINKIYRLVFKDKVNYLDITNPIENSLEADLNRRDLTINAVAVNIKTFEIIDYHRGLEDLKNHKINMICEKNFIDDPLRLLRAFRFQSNLGFEITQDVLAAIKKYTSLIHKPAYERINFELMKLFVGEYAHTTLLLMDECGLLEEIFPFVKELKQVPPNLHHHLDLFHHSVETVKQIQTIYSNSCEEVRKHMQEVDFGGFSRLAHLKFAGFLHDIGKFSTWTIEQDTGRHRFIKHDDVGSKMAQSMLKNMHFSNKQVNYISTMIKTHIYPSQVMSAPEITDKIMMRYVRKMEKNSIDNIILAKADRLSARGPEITNEIVEKNINALNYLQDFYIKISPTLEPLPKLLDGNEIMQILDIKPSKQLGDILKALNEAQLRGEIGTHKDAVAFVKSFKRV